MRSRVWSVSECKIFQIPWWISTWNKKCLSVHSLRMLPKQRQDGHVLPANFTEIRFDMRWKGRVGLISKDMLCCNLVSAVKAVRNDQGRSSIFPADICRRDQPRPVVGTIRWQLLCKKKHHNVRTFMSCFIEMLSSQRKYLQVRLMKHPVNTKHSTIKF